MTKEYVTFNTLLNVGFDDGTAELRLGPIANALATLEADVLCLQEVFSLDDINFLRDQLLAPTSKWYGGEVYVEYTQEEIPTTVL